MDSRDTNGSSEQMSHGGSSSVGGAGMHHSHSTPAGVDSVGCGSHTPPTTPKKGGKMLAIRVQMLDDTTTIFQVQAKALGQVLFDQVCKQLHLLEADYFGLEYKDLSQTRYWLDLQKPMSRQLGLSLLDPLLFFCIKFYTPDPGQLEEEYTRYLYCLQVKRDLSQGLLHCNDNTAALMASYIVQAECGDFVPEDYPDHTYLSSYKFVPHQDQEMERRIMENHKKHTGQSPAEADLNLLETARRCELYGIKLHPAKDHDNVPLNLAVAHMGIVVYQQITKINTFSWAKIRKLSFKRKKFLIKLHPEGYGFYKDTVEFFFEGRNECKNFWKKCVENHGFFRCSSVEHVSRHKTRVLSRGSSFRYSGKTQKEMVEFVRDNYVKRQTFHRSASFRYSSAHTSANNTSTFGNSISAHPLLPLADSNLSVEVSKLSASLGAMCPATGATQSQQEMGRISPTTRSAYHHRGTPTCWSSAPDTRPTTLPAQTTSSPSPPLTTQSGSPATSVVTTPQHTLHHHHPAISNIIARNSPVAVRAAVHRADTGTTLITTTRTPCNRPPSQTQSQNDLDCTTTQSTFQSDFSNEYHSVNDNAINNNNNNDDNIFLPYSKRHVWRRSASCRDLYDFSFEDSGQAKRRIKPEHHHQQKHSHKQHELTSHLDERKLESPITRYGDDHRAIYASSQNTSLEIHQDIVMPDQKVYSSSYPGTTSYSQESMEDPGNYELRDSQDDVSHDSYDLIERSDDDYSTSGECKYAKIRGTVNARSCSLDSGRYEPSDSESEGGKHHKCQSSGDLHQDIFIMEDPRDFPREIVPRKSDGSFYKNLKPTSRTSSQDSKSDYYDSRSVYKSSREDVKRRSIGSRTSSQESKSDYDYKKSQRRKSSIKHDSRQSSQESKSEYYDAPTEPKSLKHDYDRHIKFERNYGTQKRNDNTTEINHNFSSFKETSHVHSISLQNVETEQNIRANRMAANLEQNTIPRMQKRMQQNSSESSMDKKHVTHIWPESIVGVPTEIQDWTMKQQSTKSTESESNIFSFDEDRIKSLEECDDYAVVPTLPPRNNANETDKKNYRDVFVEIEPRKIELKDPILHQPIERTKSDPNNLAWQRLNSNSRRMLLKHQKSIDLTPAESSDEDYLYKQIPSAPPIMKYRGNGAHFEMPTAEFGHFDILKRDGRKTKFEVPKRQFEVLGAKTQSDFINLPPKNETDIPYILHKRHVMNGTSKEEPIDIRRVPELEQEAGQKQQSPGIVDVATSPSSFLFTQNIDLSKVDPVTLEIDKSAKPVLHLSSPKRDITRIDPALLETLNSKLSQIESDSPTSSRTESLKPVQKIKALQQIQEVPKPEIVGCKPKINIDKINQENKIKTDIKPKRVIKPRMQPGKKYKSNKTKVRITSFSSDDESLDSDDVFGSAEATPTKLEFSPPQMRKEMESILKYESERKYLQYTMSSTEVEGSPPTTRRTDTHFNRSNEEQPELRRISERSLSIPSSEDDFNIKTTDLPAVFEPDHDEVTLTLETLDEVEKEADKSIEDTVTVELTEQVTIQEFLKEEDLKEIDIEKEKEKAQLFEDIEQDIKDLKVPSKTTITEICSPTSRRKGQSPMLFAHARLNLSEGSAITLLQKQEALDSPVAGRRAKSLDNPIISVSRLPPLNSFSSKDDTVEEEEERHIDIKNVVSPVEEKPKKTEIISPVGKSTTKTEPKIVDVKVKDPKAAAAKKPLYVKQKSVEKDQIVPDVSKTKKPVRATAAGKVKPTVKTKTTVTPPKPSTVKTTSAGAKVIKSSTIIATTTSSTATISTPKTKVSSVKPPSAPKPTPPRSLAKPTPPKTLSLEKEKKPESVVNAPKILQAQNSLQLPGHEIKRTKSQEMESCKKLVTKEKAKSLEKLEFKRTSSKERTKSQDEEVDSAKRQEYQQMLYETAIKQTKTVKSPVKDILPVFPQVEEMVRERGGKLEISINTIENSSLNLEEAIIITKSPKKLDKKLLDQKLTKSLELSLGDTQEEHETNGRSMQRLGKSLDLETRIPTPEHFDFKTETIENICKNDLTQNQQESAETLDTDTEETLQDTEAEATQLILEGTSLDVWISVDSNQEDIPSTKPLDSETPELLKDIIITEKSSNFFEQPRATKPPDLIKYQDTKSSSSSQSNERLSLGSSLDMKYADESGESSHRSDSHFVQELKRASQTVEKLLMKKIEKRRKAEAKAKEIPEEPETVVHEVQEMLVRITSEEESLTSVSDMKMEYQDINFLGVGTEQRDALHKLSIERSRSEDTGSWMTVECDEYVGAESFEYDNAENLSKQATPTKDAAKSPITEEPKMLLTTQVYPPSGRKLEALKRSSDQSRSSDTGSWTSGEKDLSPGKTGDESSVSCSIGQAIGFSQAIEKFATHDQLDKSSPEMDQPRSPRSPRICVLGRTFTIDEDYNVNKSDSSSEADAANGTELSAIAEESEAQKKKPYPFEEKWNTDSELTQRLHQKITKKLSSSDKNSFSSVDDSLSDRRRTGSLEKPTLNSVDRLSAESRNSIDTESSSGSFGLANRGGINEMSCTWKRFPLESGSASSSIEDVDQELYAQEYFFSREDSSDIAALDLYKLDLDTTPTKDNVNDDKYNYPLGGFPPDLIGTTYNTPNFLSRTLSRISERSSNSEKTDEPSLSEASHEESLHQGSLSSGSPSNAQGSDKKQKSSSAKPISKESDKFELPHMSNLLQRQISDDRRTSAEMAEISIDDIEVLTSDRGLRLKRQDSDDTIIDEDSNYHQEGNYDKFLDKQSSSSQDSEEWPLPEIPIQKSLLAMHETPSSDNSQQTTQLFQPPTMKEIPKVFGLRGSIVSQSSEQWPSPPSSVAETEPNGIGNIVTKVETHYITPPEEACKVIVESNTQSYENDSVSLSDKTLEYDVEDENEDKTHTYENVATDQISESISESLSVGPSGVKIVFEPKSRSNSNSEELNVSSNVQDDVFVAEYCDSRNELRPPTVMRRSTTSDDSSNSGANNKSNGKKKSKPSHSSYSDEEMTSSMGTTLEDGTVRYAYQPTKCTHSSHSEDTSIALSLSEWSSSTTTVKFQNLSSNSGKSSGMKSNDNSLTDIAQSLSEWSSSNSNTLKAQGMQFQKLSSSTGDSSTLTEMMGKDWSTGSDKIMVSNQFYNPELQTTPPGHLMSSEELPRFPVISVQPVTLSDEKSSSSIEQRTVHTQRFDKEKQSTQKHYQTVHARAASMDKTNKTPLKLSKCSPYYSSSLSSESTPMSASHSLPMNKTATIPLMRTHKKSISKGSLFHAQSPPSENDSTSSMESANCKSEPRRGYRRRRHTPQKRHKVERDAAHMSKDDYFYVEPETSEYNEYIRNRSLEELACGYQYENIQQMVENLEEGYYPDGDSQSGSDIFRMERDELEPAEQPDMFDVSCIPPPLLEDDFEIAQSRDDNNIRDENIENNNSFYASTPNAKKTLNGNDTNITNGSYNLTLSPVENPSATDNIHSERLKNNRNINGNDNNNSNITMNTTTIIADIEGEVKKRPKPSNDNLYYIAKEILMTEITYKKDLDVINIWFRKKVENYDFEECAMLLGIIAPLAQAHELLVRDLEQRLKNWDGQGGPKNYSGRIGDILLTHLPPLLPFYEEYLDGHILVLERLDNAYKHNRAFEELYRDFEALKVCYLPLTTFILKPLHRLLHYQSLLQRVLKHYDTNNTDRADCLTANNLIKELINPVLETLNVSENFAALCELQRDVLGYDNVVQEGRKFVRHGCLLKHSKKGYQQRMFFLFSDILLYTSRSASNLQFKVHGHMPLRGVLIEEPEGELANYGLIIYGGNRALTVAANSQEEKQRWKSDLQLAIQKAKDKTDTKLTYLSLKSCSSSDEILDQCGNEIAPKTAPQRNNTTVHVCWHRNTSISMKDQLVAVENQLSGYLLRKFKSSNGWQKLWVVFTSFCLFFYKGCTDESPLASLPLLCYSVGPPTTEDEIAKEFVFKLVYKNHVYFFRAESLYTYQRWLEVIGSATQQNTVKKKNSENIANQNCIETSPEK